MGSVLPDLIPPYYMAGLVPPAPPLGYSSLIRQMSRRGLSERYFIAVVGTEKKLKNITERVT
jgi:hypothetical protein